MSDAKHGWLIILPSIHNKKRADIWALIALAIVSLVWGTTWVVSRQGVLHMPALELAGIRQIIGATCFLFYFILKKYPLPQKSDLIPIIILSVLNFVMSNGLSTWGVKYINSGLASIIGAIFPLWIVIIVLIIDKNKPPKMAVFGMLTGFGGICTIFYNHLQEFVQPDFRFGIFLSLMATLSWAFGTIYTKKHAKVFNPYFGLGFQMLLSGIILLTISYFKSDFISITAIPAISWFSIFYLVIFGSIIGFICYLYALQHLPTTQTAVYAYVNPIVAMFTGWLLLDEKLSFVVVVGCLITLSGIYLVNRSFALK